MTHGAKGDVPQDRRRVPQGAPRENRRVFAAFPIRNRHPCPGTGKAASGTETTSRICFRIPSGLGRLRKRRSALVNPIRIPGCGRILPPRPPRFRSRSPGSLPGILNRLLALQRHANDVISKASSAWTPRNRRPAADTDRSRWRPVFPTGPCRPRLPYSGRPRCARPPECAPPARVDYIWPT